ALKGFLPAVFFGVALIGFSSCNKSNTTPTPQQTQYTISPYNATSQISGTVNFMQVMNVDSVIVTIKLQGVNQDGSYPVYIRQGTSLEDGPVAFNLGFVDGQNPTLTKEIPLAFSDLANYNGCLNVYRNPNDTVTIIAQSEIGGNNVFKAYNMYNPANTSQINGQFRVYQRTTGSYLVIRIDTSLAHIGNISHPARVYTAAGLRVFDLNNVDSVSGVSATPLPNQPYNTLSTYPGSVKVLLSQDFQDVTISQGQFK
ncbi:MAG: hypothetical protein ACRDE2_07750, partial [Chitinophagaceae bacterium]